MKVLIAYATKTGTTQKAAEGIADVFKNHGWTIELSTAKKVKDISQFDAVVIGGGIRAGSWLAEASGFVRRFQKELIKKKTAFFTVCLTLKADTVENRKTVKSYLDPIRSIVLVEEEGYFPGKMNYAQLTWFPRFLISKIMKIPEGDYFQVDVVKEWAEQLNEKWQSKDS